MHITRYGHWAPIERANEFNEFVLNFLSRHVQCERDTRWML
jgi:hypothetical protein